MSDTNNPTSNSTIRIVVTDYDCTNHTYSTFTDTAEVDGLLCNMAARLHIPSRAHRRFPNARISYSANLNSGTIYGARKAFGLTCVASTGARIHPDDLALAERLAYACRPR